MEYKGANKRFKINAYSSRSRALLEKNYISRSLTVNTDGKT
jgi:hypothetical protein